MATAAAFQQKWSPRHGNKTFRTCGHIEDLQQDSNQLETRMISAGKELVAAQESQGNVIHGAIKRLTAVQTNELLHCFMKAFGNLDAIRELSLDHKHELFSVEVEMLKAETATLKKQADSGTSKNVAQHSDKDSEEMVSKAEFDAFSSRAKQKLREYRKQLQDNEAAHTRRSEEAKANIRKLEQNLVLERDTTAKLKRYLHTQSENAATSLRLEMDARDVALRHFKDEASFYKGKAQRHKEDNADLAEQVSRLKNDLERSKKTITSLNCVASQNGRQFDADMVTLQGDNETLKEQAIMARAETAEKVEQIGKLSDTIEQLESDRDMLNVQRGQTKKLLEDALRQESKWTSEIATMEINIQDGDTRLKEANSERKEAIDMLNKLHSVEHELEDKMKTVQGSLSKVEDERDHLLLEKDRLTTERDEATTKVELGNRNLSWLQNEKDDLEIQYAGATRLRKNKQDAFQAQKQSLSRALQSMTDERDALRSMYDMSTGQYSDAFQSIANIVTVVLTLRSRCTRSDRTVLEQKKELGRFGTITHLQQALEDVTLDRDEWQRKQQTSFEQLLAIEGDNLHLQQSLEESGLEASAVHRADAERISDLQGEVDELNLRAQSLANEKASDPATIKSLGDLARKWEKSYYEVMAATLRYLSMTTNPSSIPRDNVWDSFLSALESSSLVTPIAAIQPHMWIVHEPWQSPVEQHVYGKTGPTGVVHLLT
ncbi:hypothetical protein SCAR479_12847 [Seiridium cardinale]|uniref:Uncharacterized protein n=1 Tax=Seiridium cardinale TaxID=138064 RepID=A0ABR2X9S7_9PEZI